MTTDKKKGGFNFIDAVLLIAILGVVIAVIYSAFRMFVFSGESVKITYVLEVTDVAPEVSVAVVKGDDVFSFDTLQNLGTVDAVSENKDEKDNTGTVYYLTVSADAKSGKDGYTIGSTRINIGCDIELRMKNLYCTAKCVSIDEAD